MCFLSLPILKIQHVSNSQIKSEPAKPEAPTLDPNKSRPPGPCSCSLFLSTCDLTVYPQMYCVISRFCKVINFYLFSSLMVIAEGCFSVTIRTTWAGSTTILVFHSLRLAQNTLSSLTIHLEEAIFIQFDSAHIC